MLKILADKAKKILCLGIHSLYKLSFNKKAEGLVAQLIAVIHQLNFRSSYRYNIGQQLSNPHISL